MKVLVLASAMDGHSESSPSWSAPPFIDRAPVEEALRLRESRRADEVIIVAVGNTEARILLLLALGMGADRAVFVRIEGKLSARRISALVTAVAKRERSDLVLLSRSAAEILQAMSSNLGYASVAALESKVTQETCRYPTLAQIRRAAAKPWDIITASELR
jgi:electron transfer flavoprotein alpha/beta subunit